MDEPTALVGDRLLSLGQVGLRAAEAGASTDQLVLDLFETDACGLGVGARDLQVVTCGAQVGTRARQRDVRRAALLARLVEVDLGALDRVLRLRLLLLQMMLGVGVGERAGERADTERTGRTDDGQAAAGGDGEESHRCAFACSGKSTPATLTDRAHTLRYLRVNTSVGSSVSSGPRIATTSKESV